MFRKARSPDHQQPLKKLEHDNFLRERFIKENKPDLYTHSPETPSSRPCTPKADASSLLQTHAVATDENILRENKMRQLVRENSPEIRELECKLRLAYTNKLRAVQIAEKNASLARSRAREAEDARVLAKKIAEEERLEQMKDADLHRQKVEYRRLLNEQVTEQNSRWLADAYLDFLQEKMLVDEIVRKIIEEDRMKVEAQLRKCQEFRHQIDAFLHTQEECRQKEIKTREKENRDILAYLSHKDLEREEQTERWRTRNTQSEQVRDRLLAVLERSRQQLDDERNLRIELAAELKEKKEELRENRLVEQSLKSRKQLQDDLAEQLELKSQMKELEKAEENRMREKLLQRLAIEDRLEQLTVQKRRIKQMEHRRSVEALLRERQAERERANYLEMESVKKLQAIQAERQKMVEEERERILKEHAVKLFGFLPKGVLNNENGDNCK